MKAVVAEQKNAEWKVIDKPVPEPGQNQVRVKSMYMAINPVDGFMWSSGAMVTEWPFVLGCDASGVVDKCGPGVSHLKEGDRVSGCSRLGFPSFSTCQEYHLMDAKLLIKTPSNITFEQAATLGVGSLTACLGVFDGLNIKVPDAKSSPPSTDEWVLILGGTTSVGKYAVQLAKAAGYKVLGSASESSASICKEQGADEVVNYKLPEKEQVDYVMKITGGNICRIFDATAKNENVVRALLAQFPAGTKYYATTQDWQKIEPIKETVTYQCELGVIGRDDAKELNDKMLVFLPFLTELIAQGKYKPNDHVVAADKIEKAPEAFAFQSSGKGGPKKVLVKVAS